jgi:hypothetical protein
MPSCTSATIIVLRVPPRASDVRLRYHAVSGLPFLVAGSFASGGPHIEKERHRHGNQDDRPAVVDERERAERPTLVGERTRILNRLKANLARLGIRGFRPNLAQASSRLETLRTPEGVAISAV